MISRKSTASALALILARSMSSLYFGVSAADPATFAAGAALVLGVALGATALPVWLGLRRSPVATLHES